MEALEETTIHVELALGSGLMLATIIVAAMAAWLMEIGLELNHRWLMREPHRVKLFVVVLVVALGALGVATISVWIWALAFYGLGLFGTIEGSLYYALVTFTTLGYGDIILPKGWRILGGMSAANGLLIFGLITAMMVEALRTLQRRQRHHLKRTKLLPPERG